MSVPVSETEGRVSCDPAPEVAWVTSAVRDLHTFSCGRIQSGARQGKGLLGNAVPAPADGSAGLAGHRQGCLFSGSVLPMQTFSLLEPRGFMRLRPCWVRVRLRPLVCCKLSLCHQAAAGWRPADPGGRGERGTLHQDGMWGCGVCQGALSQGCVCIRSVQAETH